MEEKIKKLNVPSGFEINIYETISNIRCIKHSVFENHTIVYGAIYTYNSEPSSIEALIDVNSDGRNDYVIQVINNTNLNASSSSTIAISNLAIDDSSDDLYIMTDVDLYVCYNVHHHVLSLLYNNTKSELNCSLFMQIPFVPDNWGHTLHYSRFTRDGKYLCIAFGMPCDVCLPENDFEGQIRCYDIDIINNNNLPMNVSDYAYIAVKGMRNSVGFDFHPITQQLWFTDNAANTVQFGQLYPDDELNVVEYNGQHFGHPYCHTTGVGDTNLRQTFARLPFNDPVYGEMINCDPLNGSNYTLSIQPQGPHTAALGMQFYENKEIYAFPKKYKNAVFIAQHGTSLSPGYLVRFGYRVVTVHTKVEEIDDGHWSNTVTGFEVFMDGFFNGTNHTDLQYPWGRPMDIEILSHDGSMLVSDDYGGVIWRISYVGIQEKSSVNIPIIITVIVAVIIVLGVVMVLLWCKFCKKSTKKEFDPLISDIPLSKK